MKTDVKSFGATFGGLMKGTPKTVEHGGASIMI